MKQMILTMLLVMATLTATAQDAKKDSINEQFFNAKVRELVYRLNITDEQKSKFVPLYRNYNQEMRVAWGMPQKGKKDGKKMERKEGKKADMKQHEASSADVAKAEKSKIERQQRVQNVQMKYIDEFAKVLDAKQMKRFFEVENKIQKKLMERRMHPKGKGDKRQVKRPMHRQKKDKD